MLNLSVGKNRRGKSTFDSRAWWRAMALILIPWKMRAPKGSKAPRRAGGRDQKKGGRGALERPHSMPHWVLIQNGRHLIKKPRHLLQIQKKREKKEPLVPNSITIVLRAQRVYLFYHNHRAPKRVFERKWAPQIWVIYDNCFLRKCKCDDYFSRVARHSLLRRLVRQGGLKNCRGTMRLIPKTGAELSAVSKQLYFHTWMRADTHSGKPQWLHSQNNLGSLFLISFFSFSFRYTEVHLLVNWVFTQWVPDILKGPVCKI